MMLLCRRGCIKKNWQRRRIDPSNGASGVPLSYGNSEEASREQVGGVSIWRTDGAACVFLTMGRVDAVNHNQAGSLGAVSRTDNCRHADSFRVATQEKHRWSAIQLTHSGRLHILTLETWSQEEKGSARENRADGKDRSARPSEAELDSHKERAGDESGAKWPPKRKLSPGRCE